MTMPSSRDHQIGACLLVATLTLLLSASTNFGLQSHGESLSKLQSRIKMQHQEIPPALAAMQEQIKTNASNNKAPVIAVITQLFRDYRKYVAHRSLHLPSSYVKWVESAGGQVLPVLLNQSDAYYERVFAMSQGLLLPGGDNLLNPARQTPMLEAARKLYKMAVRSNDQGQFYPIWGTCLGMELLTVLSSERNTLANCHAEDLLLNLEITKLGRLFAAASEKQQALDVAATNHQAQNARYILSLLRNSNVTYHYHHKCITDKSIEDANLGRFYQPLAYSSDSHGLKFISIFEATQYPFYGVQFHPEKPPFEFQNQLAFQKLIPHSPEAIAVSRYFGDFFIEQAHSARSPSQVVPPQMLIYNHNPLYLAPKGDMYEQRYIWPFVSGEQNLDMSEFVDRELASGETVSEELD